jgi:hypothetical protein
VDSQIALAMIASLTSLAVAVGGIPLNYLIAKRLRREQDLDMMSHYRDPLLQAAKVVRTDRLVALEGAIVDLINFLDPDNVRYPLRRPGRVSEISSEEAAASGTQSWGKDMI